MHGSVVRLGAYLPAPIDLTAYSDTVDYEFRDADYAQEFAELNE